MLAQENFGSTGTVRLLVEVSDRVGDPEDDEERNFKNLIGVQFCDVDEDEGSGLGYYRSITSAVIGEDRDWVFVTSSQIEERIGKIKLWTLNSLNLSGFSLPGVVLVVLFAFLILVRMSLHSHQYSLQLDALEHDWKAGTLKDPVAAMIGLAKADNSH